MDTTALDHFLIPLARVLSPADVTEVCINRPGELWIETHGGWSRHVAEWATFEWSVNFGKLLAAASQQRLTARHPLLSASLPSGERVQIVAPPATPSGTVAVGIRKNSCVDQSLDNLIAGGFTQGCGVAGSTPEPDTVLSCSYDAHRWGDFLRQAVRARKNILVSGPTGAGKTTLTRALIAEVDPVERLITIEDAPELTLSTDSNAVRLFYSKDEQGLSTLTPKHLLEACLRLRPERILLAELRGAEAYHYLRAVNSGHPGSITSIHASSCRLAFEQLSLLVKESDAGRDMPRRDIHVLLRQVVDVVVHCDRLAGRRHIREIWWRGAGLRRASGDNYTALPSRRTQVKD